MGIRKDKMNIISKAAGMMILSGSLFIATNNQEAYADSASSQSYIRNSVQKGTIYNCDFLNVRKGPGTSNSIITKVYSGNSVYIQEKHSNGWYKVKTSNGQVGWVSGSYVKIQESNNNQNNNQNNQVTNNNKAKKIVDLAHKQLGKPYVWGAEGPNSFDCSGLTSYVYKNAAGVKLPRTSKSQGTVGRYVSKANLKPGDLVFFASNGKTINHVGIYIGNSKMIHSPKPGQNVRIDSISSGYYAKNYFTARVVL